MMLQATSVFCLPLKLLPSLLSTLSSTQQSAIDSKHASHTCNLSFVEVEAGGSEAQGYPSIVGLCVTLSQKTKQSSAHPHLDLNRINTDRSCALTLVASCFTLSKSGSPSSATGHPDNRVLPHLTTSDLSASYSPPATRPCCVYQLRRLSPMVQTWHGCFLFLECFSPQVFAWLTPTTHSSLV